VADRGLSLTANPADALYPIRPISRPRFPVVMMQAMSRLLANLSLRADRSDPSVQVQVRFGRAQPQMDLVLVCHLYRVEHRVDRPCKLACATGGATLLKEVLQLDYLMEIIS
jgi:hypothetical protein